MRAPHMLQNFASSVFWAPHAWQKIIRSSDARDAPGIRADRRLDRAA
jgi:hypothetical protein